MNVSSLTLNSRLAFFFYCFSVDALPDLPLLVWELWQADDGTAFGGGARHDVRVRRPGLVEPDRSDLASTTREERHGGHR